MPAARVRPLPVLLVVALIAALLGVAGVPADAAARSRSADEVRTEARLFDQHNVARTDPGAFGHGSMSPQRTLNWADDVADVARAWSDEMARTGAFVHNPNFTTETCCWSYIGENIVYTSNGAYHGSPEAVADLFIQLWMDSTGHRNNIMHPDFSQVGIGVSTSASGGVYATAVFRQPNGSAPVGSAGYPVTADDPTAVDDGPKVEDPFEDPVDEPEDPAKVPVTVPEIRSIDPACPTDQVAAKGFGDVTTGTHLRAIDCLAWWGVTTGTSTSTFDPQGTVTREQMAAFVARSIRASGGELPLAETHRFADVASDSPHAPDINALAEAGVISGFADGTYGPRQPVERGHMARFLTAAFELRAGEPLPSPSTNWFSDDDGRALESSINQAADAGWAAGFGNGTYGYHEVVRREQMAAFLTRWLATAVEQTDAPLPG